MKLLAIDTSTEACSAALLIDQTLISRYQLSPRGHSELILSFCQELLDQAGIALTQLDALGFGRGPGSFTGLRIGAAVTQGLAFAVDMPVVPISSLAAIAQGVFEDTGSQRVLTAIDARMGEVYWGEYQTNEDAIMRLQGEERVCSPADVPLPSGDDSFAAGTGWKSYAEILQQRLGRHISACEGERYVHAAHVARLAAYDFERGIQLPAEQALPVYLRNRVAQKPSR